MGEMEFLGMLVTDAILLVGFYFTLKKNTADSIQKQQSVVDKQNEQNQKLEIAITKLDVTMNDTNKMLSDSITRLTSRVDKHGDEIHELQRENEGHEIRIKTLENSHSK